MLHQGSKLALSDFHSSAMSAMDDSKISVAFGREYQHTLLVRGVNFFYRAPAAVQVSAKLICYEALQDTYGARIAPRFIISSEDSDGMLGC
jgi:hypothetical protein